MTNDLFFIRRQDAANTLGVTPPTLTRWHKRGILVMKKLSPRVMGYTREQLLSFIEKSTTVKEVSK
jgi:predicted site-specific integrase-resolvase